MPQPPRTFRIFVSSTFSDLKAERNALHERVFPALKELCEGRQARFQAIDLRWGVREEAGLDQQTMRICLDEVERCQRVTPKPNFIILLGDRYGWRPLPAEIPAVERQQIGDRLRARGEAGTAALEKLHEWYVLDENARPDDDPPGCWLLRPRTKEELGTDVYEKHEKWVRDVEGPLRRILADAMAGLPSTAGSSLRYGASATEQEIHRGALGSKDAAEHVFCFLRTIDGLPVDASGRGFRDLVPEDPNDPDSAVVVDDEAEDLLAALKQNLRDTLPTGHIFEDYRARWTPAEEASTSDAAETGKKGDGGEPQDPAPDDEGPPPISLDHLDRLCADVERTLREAIVAELDRLDAERARAERTEVDDEAAAHRAFARERLGSKKDPKRSIFVGREAPLRRIADYLAGDDRRPLALIGEPGSGKSAVMAQAFAAAWRAHASRDRTAREAALVCRFIGWTPGSAVIRELLDKLCREISRLYGADEETPSEYQELVQEFPKRLGLATAARPLLLFIDALDQLTDADNARNLAWLPTELPEHVRLVVSTSTEPGDTVAVVERRLAEESRCSLDDMPVDEAGVLLGAWLDDVDRTLVGRPDDIDRTLIGRADEIDRELTGRPNDVDRTLSGRPDIYERSSGQWRYVVDRYQQCPRPLYLKLAFEEARRWRAFDAVEGAGTGTGGEREVRLAPDIQSLIEQLFERLASPANHGETIVSRSLGYLLAGKNGLGEDELIEVLSRDPEVLKEVKRFHRPPEEKLPVVIWSRLYFDLEPYLTSRAADGTTLLAFYHRQLEEVGRKRFLEPFRHDRHRSLAEFFADQELLLGEPKTGNLRVLSELPYQQMNAADPNDRDDPMWANLYETLTDFDFLEVKCTYAAVTTQGSGDDERRVYGGVYELQEDYRRALEVFPEE